MPLSSKSGVGVYEDRWSSWQELGCLGHLAQRYKQLLTCIYFSKMSSSPSRCPMSTKVAVGVYEDRASSWKELGCPGHYSRWSEAFLLKKSASPVSRNLTMVDQLLGISTVPWILFLKQIQIFCASYIEILFCLIIFKFPMYPNQSISLTSDLFSNY